VTGRNNLKIRRLDASAPARLSFGRRAKLMDLGSTGGRAGTMQNFAQETVNRLPLSVDFEARENLY
jgi:hypothetical protein